jgi:hypothetical protein
MLTSSSAQIRSVIGQMVANVTCDWRPERWDNLPEAVSNIPGVWGHLLTFLGGPRACIGYRFSLVEYVLVRYIQLYPMRRTYFL